MMNTSHEFGFHNENLTAQHMPRPRLNQTLDQAARATLVYVIAGAGYGKTQAVRHYIEQQQEAVVRWIQLTESDNVSSRFWENISHAVSGDNPDLAMKLRELGFPETLARFRQFLEMLRSTEYRAHKTFIVIDDFHLIQTKEVAAFVERFVHLQNPGVCTVILSRKEPEINAVSLASKGHVSTIAEQDLRFTKAEVLAFFQQCAISLSADELSQLMEATKGWALALNMFSLILKRIPDNVKYALGAMRQNLFKLLENEAWNNFPEGIQKAIAKVSLLSNLPTIPLRGVSDDPAFLEHAPGLASFIRFNSFTNDLRIHPLYLEFLQNKHHILSQEEKLETFRWAAQWCLENEFYMDAMYYYAKSHQFERMVKTLLSYPFKLPYDTSAYFLSILNNLEPGAEEQGDPHVLVLKSCFVPLLLTGMGRYEEALEETRAVIAKWEGVDSPISIVLLYTAYSTLAYIDMHTCTVTHEYNAPIYLKKSVEYYKRSFMPPAKLSGAFLNADIRSFACLVGEGADLSKFDQFLEAARQTALYVAETPHNIHAGYAEVVACEQAFFKNQPEIARSYAHNAILQAREKKQYSIVMLAENYLLRIAVQTGDVSLAKKTLKQMGSHLNNMEFWSRQVYYDLYAGFFYATIGRPEMGPQWFIMDGKETLSEIRIPARELVVSAWYYIASKKYHQALMTLCNSYPREPQERFYFGEMRLRLLTAVARIQTGDTKGAMADFKKAYDLSFHGVFELFFIELGKELHPLIVEALKREDCGIPEEWLKTMDRKASIFAKKVAVIANGFKDEMGTQESISLSKREQEVLTDLYHGLSREEIAENRYLSINTVKKILQSIYIKLDAHNNVDAVRIALEKKLIE